MSGKENRDGSAITPDDGSEGQRIDRWLWYARFLKSRTLAQGLIQSAKLRVNGERIARASRLVRRGRCSHLSAWAAYPRGEGVGARTTTRPRPRGTPSL